MTWTVPREMVPIYAMGTADEQKFQARRRRGIAGSMVFIQFDTTLLMDEVANIKKPEKLLCFDDDLDDLRPELPPVEDLIPPFDIVLTAANMYGDLATMKILGAELMYDGYGITPDDIVSGHSYTYIAHGMVPWTDQPRPEKSIIPVVKSIDEHEGMIYNEYSGRYVWL
jgi:hypothetical protein